MASRIGDSDGARRLARDLRSAAAEVDRAEREFRRVLDNTRCRGLASLSRGLFSLAGSSATHVEYRYRDLASSVDRHARWVEDTEQELWGIERRIRSWAAAHPVSPDPTSTAPDASLIRYWPASLSYEWRDLKARLRAHGVWV